MNLNTWGQPPKEKDGAQVKKESASREEWVEEPGGDLWEDNSKSEFQDLRGGSKTRYDVWFGNTGQ